MLMYAYIYVSKRNDSNYAKNEKGELLLFYLKELTLTIKWYRVIYKWILIIFKGICKFRPTTKNEKNNSITYILFRDLHRNSTNNIHINTGIYEISCNTWLVRLRSSMIYLQAREQERFLF